MALKEPYRTTIMVSEACPFFMGDYKGQKAVYEVLRKRNVHETCLICDRLNQSESLL